MAGLVSSIIRSMALCSSSVSVSFSIETLDCASTTRQHSPVKRRALDESASCVQILDDIDQSGHALDQIERDTAKSRVFVAQPSPCDLVVAADDGIQGAIEADKKDAELERLLPPFQSE